MNFSDIRAASCELAKKYGIRVPASLPLLDANSVPRPISEIIDRALAVLVVVAASYGFKRNSALLWLERESLMKSLTRQEQVFLNGSDENRQMFQGEVETLCAFAWSLGLLADLDYAKDCPNHLVSLYPDLKKLEPAGSFREKAKLQPIEQLITACDVAYCLHWGLNQAILDGTQPKRHLSPTVVTERRRALEWILSKEDWNDIKLDT